MRNRRKFLDHTRQFVQIDQAVDPGRGYKICDRRIVLSPKRYMLTVGRLDPGKTSRSNSVVASSPVRATVSDTIRREGRPNAPARESPSRCNYGLELSASEHHSLLPIVYTNSHWRSTIGPL